MIRMTPLLLVCLIAACGGSQEDPGAMIDDGAEMMADTARMGEPMGSGMTDQSEMGQDSSAMGGMSGGGTMADTAR